MYNFWFLKNPIKKKYIIIASQLINCISGVLAKEFLFAQEQKKKIRNKKSGYCTILSLCLL